MKSPRVNPAWETSGAITDSLRLIAQRENRSHKGCDLTESNGAKSGVPAATCADVDSGRFRDRP